MGYFDIRMEDFQFDYHRQVKIGLPKSDHTFV